MKLLNRTTIFTSTTTLLLLLACAIIVYSLIIKKINSENTEHLLMDKAKVIRLLDKGKPPIHFSSNIGEKISITKIPVKTLNNDVFKDYTTQEEGEEDGDDKITLRELTCQVQLERGCYEIKITRSLSEGEEIRDYMISTVIFFLFFSLILLFILNIVISKRIWSPFYHTMSVVKQWSIMETKPIQFKRTAIDEFNELNAAVYGLTEKIKADYSNLKEFTENISHETQTPLAIISTKIELLMQESNYSEDQKRLLSQSYEAIQRLKKLNETLITLTRIENNQFSEIENIDISIAVKNILLELSEFIEAKKIHVELNLISVYKAINPVILTILLNNLFINSIKHNLTEFGFIRVHLDSHGLSVLNSSDRNEIEEKHLFERFKSYSTNADSIGLGLSIIKKITNFLGWSITYKYYNTIHEFELKWN